MPKSKKSSKEVTETRNPSSISSSRPSKKRLRIQTSGEDILESDEEKQATASSRVGRTQGRAGGESSRGLVRGSARVNSVGEPPGGSSRGEKSKVDSEVRKIKQRLRRAEAERKKFEDKLASKRNQLALERERVSVSERKVDKLKKDGAKMKKTNEKLTRDKEEAMKEFKEDNLRWRKKVDSLKQKLAGLELERVKLESKISSLSISDPGAGSSGAGASGSSGASAGPGGLFQDMMDNFRELAETQLQCAVCSELFVEATSINCGHTFCSYCISEWKKKKANCPVCRTDIKQTASCKVLDDYTDKLYDQFVSAGGKQQRQVLKEEREKIKKEAEVANQARTQERRERAQQRRAGGLEMVNIVLNRARRPQNEDDDTSLDSDATLELHLSDAARTPELDSDSDSSIGFGDAPQDNTSASVLNDSHFLSDTDSSDISFRSDNHDTDSVSDSSDSAEEDTSPLNTSDSSSDSDSD